MPLKAIIFDVDGTLAETEEAHREAFNRAFAEAEKPWHWTEHDYAALLTTTGGRERIARYVKEIGLVPDPQAIGALHVRKNEIYADLVAGGSVVPRPGVVPLIDEARERGIMLAIATTTSRSNLFALLDHLFGEDSRRWFSAIVTGEDVAAKKPDPEAYRYALSRLGLEASDCVAIEDSRNGLLAARACGIATVVTPSRYTLSEPFLGAALVCDSLGEPRARVDVARLESLLPGDERAPLRKTRAAPRLLR